MIILHRDMAPGRTHTVISPLHGIALFLTIRCLYVKTSVTHMHRRIAA